MELAARLPQRVEGLDLLAAHLARLDPDAERARDRLERRIGPELTRLLIAALSSSRRVAAAA